jgi:hypothetical protein
MRTGDAGESPYGSGDWWCWCQYWRYWRAPGLVALKRGVLMAEFSVRSVSAGSQLSAPGACTGSVGGLRCVVMLRAACCVVRVRDAYTGRADGLRCVELLPTQVGAAAVMNSRRGRSCWWYCRSERSAGRTGTDELTAKGPYFIPFPLGSVRARCRRSGSCVRWLASACVGVQATEWRTAVYKNCLRSLRGVCWPRSLFVRSTVIEGVSPSVWLWEVPTQGLSRLDCLWLRQNKWPFVIYLFMIYLMIPSLS